ncbi:hypothetical protein NQ317_007323 [Molorchus minor]|uniref:R3H domain-containing protein n=1 Tax=Molorchus minor TaxID=1323400 RepID=A0ABQ9IXQ4_9CUCU|nr:hypothetical protein NQ317_007323 [Molorchus minor]
MRSRKLKEAGSIMPQDIQTNPLLKQTLDVREATPELLRIEIDQIFKKFLDDPDVSEFIFPANLNNLQRKYIHSKAQAMNIISKSYGKEPDRKLHIKRKIGRNIPSYMPPFRRMRRAEKVIGKLVDGVPTLPVEVNLPSSYAKEMVTIRQSLPDL